MLSPGPDRRCGRASRISANRPNRGAAAAGAAVLLVLGGCAGGARVTLRDAAPPTPSRAPRLVEQAQLRLPDPSELFTPTVLGLDATGRVYVTDAARGRVAVFEAERFLGFLEPPIASTGSSGRLSDVRGMAGSTGGLTLYVLDGGRGRLYGYDLGLRFRGTALDLTDPTVTARFGRVDPDGVTFDPSGRAILSDREGERLLVFDPQWRPDREIGGPGGAGRGFLDPGALAPGRSGEIVVVDRGNRTLQRVDSGGRLGAAQLLPRPGESVTSAGAGRYLVGDAAGDVQIVDAAGVRLLLSAPAGIGGPAWVAKSPDGGRLYVARPGAGVVLVYAWNDSVSGP